MKILAIEDDPGICALTKRVLDSAQVAVEDFRCLNTMEAGLAELDRFTPDLILLDLRLPGWEVQDTLAKIPMLAGIAPVVVLSGTAEQHFVEAVELGAADCLSKSVYLMPRHEGFLAHQLALAQAHWRCRHAKPGVL